MIRPGRDDPAPAVFLSYARADLDLARGLAAAITGLGHGVVMDVTDIAPGEDWQARLDGLLRSAAKVVFLATSASVASAACAHELALAKAEGKPVLPVLPEGIPRNILPAAIAQLNYVRLQANDPGRALTALDTAIRTDLDWERQKAVWLLRAATVRGLLHGRAELTAAETWALSRPATAAPVPDSVIAMIARSRSRLRHRARLGAMLVLLVATGFAILGLLAVERANRIGQLNAILLAGEAERLAEEGRIDEGLLVALVAAEAVSASNETRLAAALARVTGAAEGKRHFLIPGDASPFEHDNRLYYHVQTSGVLWRLDPETGPEKVADWPGHLVGIETVWSRDGFSRAVVMNENGAVVAYLANPETGERRQALTLMAPQDWPMARRIQIGPDGRGIIEATALWPVPPPEGMMMASDLRLAFDLGSNSLTPAHGDPGILVADHEGRSILMDRPLVDDGREENPAFRPFDVPHLMAAAGDPDTYPSPAAALLSTCIQRSLGTDLTPAERAVRLEVGSGLMGSFFQSHANWFSPMPFCGLFGNFAIALIPSAEHLGGAFHLQVQSRFHGEILPSVIVEQTVMHPWRRASVLSPEDDALSLAVAQPREVLIMRVDQGHQELDVVTAPFVIGQVVVSAPDQITLVEAGTEVPDLWLTGGELSRGPALNHQAHLRVLVMDLPLRTGGPGDTETSAEPGPEANLFRRCMLDLGVPPPTQIDVEGQAVVLADELRNWNFAAPCFQLSFDLGRYAFWDGAAYGIRESGSGRPLGKIDLSEGSAWAFDPDDARQIIAEAGDSSVVRLVPNGQSSWSSTHLFTSPGSIWAIHVLPGGWIAVVSASEDGNAVLRLHEPVGYQPVRESVLGDLFLWNPADVFLDRSGDLVLSGQGPEGQAVIWRAPSVAAGVAAARAALSQHCQPVAAADWTSSPCWPANL